MKRIILGLDNAGKNTYNLKQTDCIGRIQLSENRVLKREEVDGSLTWALSDIFATDDDWEKAFEQAQAIPAQIAA